MSTGIRNLDNAIQTTNIWLRDLDRIMGWDDRAKSYAALRTVLHALRDELMLEEAVDLAAQLPMILRGMYYEGWMPSKTPRRERNLEAFLQRVAKNYMQSPDFGDEIDASWLCRCVFTLLSQYVSSGEIDDVKSMLTGDLQGLWPEESEEIRDFGSIEDDSDTMFW